MGGVSTSNVWFDELSDLSKEKLDAAWQRTANYGTPTGRCTTNYGVQSHAADALGYSTMGVGMPPLPMIPLVRVIKPIEITCRSCEAGPGERCNRGRDPPYRGPPVARPALPPQGRRAARHRGGSRAHLIALPPPI